MSEKIQLAKNLLESERETRLILIDDLNGTAHKAYGGFPDMVYVINKKGRIAFRSDWNNTNVLKNVLKQLKQDEDKIIIQDIYPMQKPMGEKIFNVLLRGGVGAITDVLFNIGGMFTLHKARNKAMKRFKNHH